MKPILLFLLVVCGSSISVLGQEAAAPVPALPALPAPFPEVGKTYFVRYAPGFDNIYNTIKVLRVEDNGWILAEVPNKAFWINPAFIAMANLIEPPAN